MSDATRHPADEVSAAHVGDLPAPDAQADGAGVKGGGIGTSPTAPQPVRVPGKLEMPSVRGIGIETIEVAHEG